MHWMKTKTSSTRYLKHSQILTPYPVRIYQCSIMSATIFYPIIYISENIKTPSRWSLSKSGSTHNQSNTVSEFLEI